MKKIIPLFYLFFSFSSEALTLKLFYPDKDSPPNQMGNDDKVADPPGLSLDVISKAANDLKINIEYFRVPTNRVFITLKKEEADGIFVFSYLPERTEYGVFPFSNGKADSSRRVFSLKYHFYRNKNSTVSWDGTKLLNYNSNIGASRGSSVIETLKKLNIPFEESKGSEVLFKKVSAGRLDVLVEHDLTIDIFNSKLPDHHKIVKLNPAVLEKDYFLVFGKNFYEKNKDLCEKFWNQIGKVRDDTIKQNIHKYK
ncbi:substrate-binding periplasmic protein [Pigmentibacter ruber]|uniref:substrate-binding periplasmic protein n=1 Tax=Pigmentibacter ruber TaxID=2683196 RepID=UPI00131A620D|nr:transporter substrate-binding domain-containing protein [Pigmentibacter ruber]